VAETDDRPLEGLFKIPNILKGKKNGYETRPILSSPNQMD